MAVSNAMITGQRSPFYKLFASQWMTSAGFGVAVLVDSLLTGTLILVLQKSRTGFRKFVSESYLKGGAKLTPLQS